MSTDKSIVIDSDQVNSPPSKELELKYLNKYGEQMGLVMIALEREKTIISTISLILTIITFVLFAFLMGAIRVIIFRPLSIININKPEGINGFYGDILVYGLEVGMGVCIILCVLIIIFGIMATFIINAIKNYQSAKNEYARKSSDDN